MIDDPWATETNTIDNTKETVTVATAEETFCITLKQQGKDAPWIVIRSATADEAKSRLQEATNSGLFDAVNQAQTAFVGGQAMTASAPPAQPQQSYQAPPAQPQVQGDGRTCAHGVMNYREGTNKNGKPYKAYFCLEQDRSQQCRAVWL